MRNGEQVSHSSRSGWRLPGTAFDDVRDVYIFALHAHRLDHIVEQTGRAADERLTLRVFIGAGAFAHKHQLGA